MAFEIVKSLLESSIYGSRSTALKPLALPTAAVIAGSALSIQLGGPIWLTGMFGALVALLILLFCIAYVYFMIKDKEYLRSEGFIYRKMALEHGLRGDDEQGLFEIDEIHDEMLLEEDAGPGQSEKEDR